MKVAIVGSREWEDPAFVEGRVADVVFGLPSHATIVSGGARGVDTWARKYATRWERAYEEFPADWEHYGRSAGFKRNEDIVKAADKVIVFWNGESRGTKHDIDLALRYHKDLEVHFP